MRVSLLALCVFALLALAAADPGLLPGEGSACKVGGAAGVCSAQPCAGTSFSGKCPGPAAVRCCLPPGAAPSTTPAAPAKAAPASPKPAAPAAPATPAKPAAPAKPAKPAAPAKAEPAKPAAPAKAEPTKPAAPAKAEPTKPAAPAAPAKADAAAPAAPAAAPGAGMLPVPAGVKLLPGTPTKPWTYSFPYAQGRHLVADMALQRLRLYDGSKMVKEYKISTGKLGIGNKADRANTPYGKLRIAMKVGTNQPLGMIIEKLTPQKRIGKESDSHAHMQTRILVLEGLEEHNKNTRARSIYIHGTNREARLGRPDSAGCFRIGNKEIVELYDMVSTGTEFYAIPYAAWPN